MTQENNTTVKSKGHRVIRYEGATRIVSELVWLGGPVGKQQATREELIGRIVSIRRAIRKQAEEKLVETVCCRLMERTRQKLYQAKVERAKELEVAPKYIRGEVVLAKRGYQVISM